MRIGLNGAQDVLALLVRRKWWILYPFVAFSCAAAVLTLVLPKTYVSETLILVRPRDVPEEFVKDLIAGSAVERVKSIEQTLLSRTNLLQVLREFADDLPEFKPLNLDEKVLKLRNQVNIDFQIERSSTGKEVPLTYFRITCQNQRPEMAQKIAARLTALFVDQDNRTRADQVVGTTEFLTTELAKVQTDLTAAEGKLKEVKSARQFELPNQLDANLRTLDQLQTAKRTNAEALDRSATVRLNLESQIAQTPETLAQAAPPATVVPNAPQDPAVEEYRKAEAEYRQAAAKYTAIHPEVLAAAGKVSRLKKQMSPELLASIDNPPEVKQPGAPAAGAPVPNPLYQVLAGKLRETETEYKLREREKGEIEAEIAKYSRRVENTPNTEQEMSDVLRSTVDLKKQYDDLNDKLAQAKLSESLESKQKGSQFVIVDPANYPLTPSKPNKPFILLGACMVSLLAAIALAALIDIGRQKIWLQSQVEVFWGVPVLVDIPSILIDSDLNQNRKKKVVFAASSVAGAVAYSFCLYLLYVKHGFVLQHLDPVLQKFVYK